MDNDTEHAIRFGANFDDLSAGPPSRAEGASVVRVRDVVLCPTGGGGTGEDGRLHPPIGVQTPRPLPGQGRTVDSVDLGRGVSIERLPSADARLVLNACTPRGHYFFPVKQFGQRYSFVCEQDVAEADADPYRWDPQGRLWDALTLSRLVRDNAYSTEYAARIIDYSDGSHQVVYTLLAESRHVYRVRQDRDWLDADDAEALRRLLAAYWRLHDAGGLPERVRRGLWRCEYASWMRTGDLIVPILTSGLEALLKTERHRATRQFKVRVAAVADELGIEDVNQQMLERIYDARSEWVHGAHVRLFTVGPEDDELERTEGTAGPQTTEQRQVFTEIALLQDVLRTALRRAIEDDEWRDRFQTDDDVRRAWPID